MVTLTHAQLRTLDIAARASACLSLTGATFTITSYTCCPALRKPFNRLALCFAITNSFGCLAYSWGIYPMHHGRTSAFCQTQAFLIQWFVMTDPLLALTMAVSVWLRICARRSVKEIRTFENVGIGSAFTLPFIPALVFLFWRPNGFTVYGPAGSWCWISEQSNLLRLVSFYAPIWGMILCSIFLFILSGRRILQIRANVRRTQVMSKSEPEDRPRPFTRPNLASFNWQKPTSLAELDRSQPTSSNSTTTQPTSWDLRDNAPSSREELVTVPTNTNSLCTTLAPTPKRASLESDLRLTRTHKRSNRFEAVPWKYAKFAFLCTIVLFITWIPISINRLYNGFINTEHPVYGLYFASALSIPLHGFGNFIIYVNTSWAECKAWVLGLLPQREQEKAKEIVSSDNCDARSRDDKSALHPG